MFEHPLVIDHRPDHFLVHHVNLADLVRRAKPVEEMQEWNARFECGRVGNQRKVLRFLHRVGAQHRPTRLPRRHHVRVIAKNRKPLRRQRTRRDVENRRRQFAGDLVHVGNHQQQSLRGSESGGKRTGLQRAVNRARRAALALHLDRPTEWCPRDS